MKSGRERKVQRKYRKDSSFLQGAWDKAWVDMFTAHGSYFKIFRMKQSKHLRRGLKSGRFAPRDGMEPRGSHDGDTISIGVTATEVAGGLGRAVV